PCDEMRGTVVEGQVVDDRNLLAHCGPPPGSRGPQISPERRTTPRARRWADASVAELADAPGLGPGLERGGSSSLPARTHSLTHVHSPGSKRGDNTCAGYLWRSSSRPGCSFPR